MWIAHSIYLTTESTEMPKEESPGWQVEPPWCSEATGMEAVKGVRLAGRRRLPRVDR